MNIAEGARRIRRAGQWIFLLAVTAMFLWYGAAWFLKVTLPGLGELAQIALFGVALWVFAWIVEGFAEKTL